MSDPCLPLDSAFGTRLAPSPPSVDAVPRTGRAGAAQTQNARAGRTGKFIEEVCYSVALLFQNSGEYFKMVGVEENVFTSILRQI